jgi:hypothetical protein
LFLLGKRRGDFNWNSRGNCLIGFKRERRTVGSLDRIFKRYFQIVFRKV